MNITEINVPKNVRYISQWKGFKLENFPHIIDKQIPGCGFTEYCITNPLDLILVCPRKILLQNKENQHPGEVFYAKSELLEELSIDKNLLKIPKIKNLGIAGFKPKSVIEEEKRIAREKADRERAFLKSEIESYWFLCQGKKKPAKILVTYDSFRKVKEILQDLGIFENFYTVIDEFQSIFVDSRFKADTEMEFIDAIKDIQRVCYVSATPMIESYLDRLDQFKDLPYFKFNWVAEDPGRVSKPGLTIRALSSVNQVAEKVIDTYKAGNFETSVRINKDGSKEIVESRIENIKEAYERGEISQAQYLTYVETQPDLNVPMGSKNPYPTNSDFEQVQIPDPGAELTEEDKIFLAMKWGRLYKSEDWVALEKVYADYENSFDIHNADLEKGLIQLCKLDLKLNQALDTGDFDSYAKLYRSYDALRKSLKFTEAQNKDGDNSDFDSIGAIVAFCEKEGGFIPRYVTDAPKDVIDIIIQDNKEYLQTLIHNDTNLSQQIEQFLKKKEILLQQKEDRKLAKLKGLDTVEVTDQDYADFYKAMKGGNIIEEEGDEDA